MRPLHCTAHSCTAQYRTEQQHCTAGGHLQPGSDHVRALHGDAHVMHCGQEWQRGRADDLRTLHRTRTPPTTQEVLASLPSGNYCLLLCMHQKLFVRFLPILFHTKPFSLAKLEDKSKAKAFHTKQDCILQCVKQ